MHRDEFDDQIEGQMTIEDLFQPPEKLFAVHRIFARARKSMTLAEQQTLVFALTQIRFTGDIPEQMEVNIDKRQLAAAIGMKTDTDHLSVDLYKKLKNISKNSMIEIADEDKAVYSSGVLITDINRIGTDIVISFNRKYLGLFTGLSRDYITMWSGDIFKMRSVRSVQFYELLRQLTDTRYDICSHGWGVKQLKELFGIPKDGPGSYMRKDGHFDRPAFERYVIQPLCDDLQKCKMISLVLQPDKKFYEKVKVGKRVVGYRFYWVFTSSPKVASAKEVHEIQERVDKNPAVLKVAKNLLDGESRGTGSKKNEFNQFEQNKYDFDKLEEELRWN